MISIDEQIEYMQSIVATSMLPTHMPKAILASLERLKAIDSVQVPDEPVRRDRAEAAEAKLAAMLKLGEEPSEEMANEVRGILQILRGMTGATFDKVREHCKYRGDNAELWPVWAMKAEGYVTEQGAAMLIFNIMFAKMAEQAGVKK